MKNKVQDQLKEAIAKLKKPVTVPEINIALGEQFSDGALYSLLTKMRSAGIVNRHEEDVIIKGHTLKKVTWTIA